VIQGTAADLIKRAMIQLYEKLSTRKLLSSIVAQIHDEVRSSGLNERVRAINFHCQIILIAPFHEIEDVVFLVRNAMENCGLGFPTPVTIRIGKSLLESDLENYDDWEKKRYQGHPAD
jgi:DNA polymerase-1